MASSTQTDDHLSSDDFQNEATELRSEMKAPEVCDPSEPGAIGTTAVASLRGLRDTVALAHQKILRKLDQEIHLLLAQISVEAEIPLMEVPSLESVADAPDRPPSATAFVAAQQRRSVTLQDPVSPGLVHSVGRPRSATAEPGLHQPEELENSPGLDVVPAPRGRTDPKAFLPSLSMKKNRNYFRQQSMAVLQEGGSPVRRGSGQGGNQRNSANSLASGERRKSRDSQEMTWRPSEGKGGIFGGMRSQFSIESVQMHALSGMEVEEKADNGCAKIVSHPFFDRIMMLVVMLNCIEMAVSVEFDRDHIHKGVDGLRTALLVSSNFFCTMFLGEIILRWMAYARCASAFQDGWFLFDMALVLLMMWETWAMPFVMSDHNEVSGAWRMARILRVLRTARMARLVRLMPELMILIKGMIVACRSVFFTLMLLLIITFIFSIAFLELSSHTPLEDEYFQSIPDAIVSLILHCIVPDQEEFFKSLASESWILGLLVLLFILLGSLTVMNMLLGVLVEAVKTVSTIEQEQMMADFARKVLWKLIQDDGATATEEIDYHHRMISEKEFRSLLRKPRAVKALQKLGVDASAALDYGKMMFEDDEAVSFVEFMHAMLTLRGSNKTTVKDIVELRKFVGEEFTQIRSVLSELGAFIGDSMWNSTGRSPQNPMAFRGDRG